MSSEHVPQIDMAATTRAELNKYGILAWSMLFSLLFDPEPDGEFKIYANYYPYHPDTILFSDDEWYVVYRIMDNGDIRVGYISNAPDIYSSDK